MNIDALTRFNETVVSHNDFKNGLAELNDLLDLRMRGVKKSQGVALWGESGLGKTTLLKKFKSSYPDTESCNGSGRPIILVTVPPDPTGGSLCSAILAGLGDPFAHSRATESEKRHRVIQLIKQCNVSVMMLDEIQHLSTRWGKIKRHDAADSFKVIMDATDIIMVLSGLEYGSALFRDNEQFSRRFTRHIKLRRFVWDEEESRKQFRGLLLLLKNNMGDQVETIDIASGEVAFRFFLASGGLISRVVTILEKSLGSALLKGQKEIGLNDFAKAYEGLICDDELMSNPFLEKLNHGNKNNLLKKSSSIGIVPLLKP